MKLVRFLQKLANETVVLETKNDMSIQGTVVGVDMSMNTHLKNVKVTRKNQSAIGMDHLTVRGSSVRYVILPDSIPLDTLLIDEAPKKAKAAAGGRGRGRGFGRGRGALRRQKR